MMSDATPDDGRWSIAQRVGFRFGFIYALMFVFSLTWSSLTPWVAGDVLGIAEPGYGGSGDTSYHYVRLLVDGGLALVGCVAWTLADRRSLAYPRLVAVLALVLRLYLLLTMVGVYGLGKVFKTQFPDPSLIQLMTPVGELSPMGLAWTFMGYSTTYTVFTGVAEVVGGLLLAARRTTTLGALVLVGVLSNVVLMNLAYDIPVKQYSMHLLAAALFLAALDGRRLLDAFVLGRPTEPPKLLRVFESPRAHALGRMLMVIAVLGIIAFSVWQVLGLRARIVDAPASPLHGIWQVERFEREGMAVPPCTDQPTRWRRLIVARRYRGSVELMSGERVVYNLKIDASADELVLKPRYDTGTELVLTIERPTDTRLVLLGNIDGIVTRIELARETRDSPLLTRGFRWISDRPFNR
jgi:uncharacterized membrane protein YphA (DoxX/SURF4 family)